MMLCCVYLHVIGMGFVGIKIIKMFTYKFRAWNWIEIDVEPRILGLITGFLFLRGELGIRTLIPIINKNTPIPISKFLIYLDYSTKI